MMPQTDPDLLAAAEASLAGGDAAAAGSLLAAFLDGHAPEYRSLVLAGKLHRAAGAFEAAERAFVAAMACEALPDLDLRAAFLSVRVARQQWGVCNIDFDWTTRDMISATITQFRGTEGARWHEGRLHALRGLHSLAVGDLAGADRDITEAYRCHGAQFSEGELLFDWVRTLLADAARFVGCATLRYLAWVAAHAPSLSYATELALLNDDTYVLEIGAMDGVRYDPLREPLTTRPWRAVLVEPTSAMFAELQRNYAAFPKVRCLRAAISGQDGVADIHFIRPDCIARGEIGEWGYGVSKLAELKYLEAFSAAEPVRTLTFASLVKETGIPRIDVLQIDTEGHDYEIFRQIDLVAWPVRLLYIELAWLLPAQRLAIIETLLVHGYRLSFDGADLTARRRDA